MTDEPMMTPAEPAGPVELRDAAALFLAAAGDREAFDRALKDVRAGEVATLLHAALEVGGTLARHPAAAEYLRALIAELQDDGDPAG